MSKVITGATGIAIVLFALTVWAQPPQDLQQCRSQNSKNFGEVVQLFQKLIATKALQPQDAQKIDARLRSVSQRLNKNLTPSDCQRLASEIAAERANLQKITANAPDPRVDQCRSQTSRAVQSSSQLFGQACKMGYLSQGDAQVCSEIEKRRSKIIQDLSKRNMTLADCQQFSSEVVRDQSTLQRVASGRELLQRCRSQNQTAFKGVAELVRIAGGKNLLPPERSLLDIKKKRLNEIDQALRRANLTLSECQNLTAEITAERSNIQNVLAGISSRQQAEPCRAQARSGHAQAVRLLEKACTTRNLSQSEARNCQDTYHRLDTFMQKLSSPALSLQACQQVSREIAAESNKIQAMNK